MLGFKQDTCNSHAFSRAAFSNASKSLPTHPFNFSVYVTELLRCDFPLPHSSVTPQDPHDSGLNVKCHNHHMVTRHLPVAGSVVILAHIHAPFSAALLTSPVAITGLPVPVFPFSCPSAPLLMCSEVSSLAVAQGLWDFTLALSPQFLHLAC